MKKNNDSVQNILNNIKFKPSINFADRFFSLLQKEKIENVTNPLDSRNNNIIYFLKITAMKVMSIKTKAGIILSSVVVVGVMTTTAAFASTGANPGDPLFPIQKAIENVQRTFASDKVKFEQDLLTKRIDQLQTVQTQSPDNTAKIKEALNEVDTQKQTVDSKLATEKSQDVKDNAIKTETEQKSKLQDIENVAKDTVKNDVKNLSQKFENDKTKTDAAKTETEKSDADKKITVSTTPSVSTTPVEIEKAGTETKETEKTETVTPKPTTTVSKTIEVEKTESGR